MRHLIGKSREGAIESRSILRLRYAIGTNGVVARYRLLYGTTRFGRGADARCL